MVVSVYIIVCIISQNFLESFAKLDIAYTHLVLILFQGSSLLE